jgi:hypothetical protein
MALVLDKLKDNNIYVILNTVQDNVVEFYDGESFIHALKLKWGIDEKDILNKIDKDTIYDFFELYDLDLNKLTEVLE